MKRHGRSPVLRVHLVGAPGGGRLWPGRGPDQRNGDDRCDGLTPDAGGVRRRDGVSGQPAVGPQRRHLQVLFVDSGLDILRLGNWYQNRDATDTTPDTPSPTDLRPDRPEGRRRAGRNASQDPDVGVDAARVPQEQRRDQATPRARRADVPAGTLSQSGGSYAYAEYADWWVRALRACAAQGVVPDYVSIQNEPDFFTRYWETCLFGASEGASMEGITVAVTDRRWTRSTTPFSSDLASPPVLLGPETTGFLDGGRADTRTDSTSRSWAASPTTSTEPRRTIPATPTGSAVRCAPWARPPPPWCRPS